MQAGGVIEQDFRRFGPYVLLRCSGAGGFGRVDLALKGPPELAKVCVVKRMQQSERTPELEARFRREAHIVLRLAHGAIAQTVGVEEIDGELCLLQEFVDGANLAQLLGRAAPDKIPLLVALHIGREVARALAYAHGQGIVHRDVTPDNVMLSWSGEVKLIDFGIARADSEAALTSAGIIIGRETYTAPEVWAGKKADARSDLFSLGVVLWRLLTGDQPEDVGTKSGAGLPDPCVVNPDLPLEVGTAVRRALEINPSLRWNSATEFGEALGRLIPAGFQSEPEVAGVLSRYFNVETERKILDEDLAAAKRVLATDADPEVFPSQAAGGQRKVLFGGAVLLGVLVGIGGSIALRLSRSDSSAAPALAASEVIAQPKLSLTAQPTEPAAVPAAVPAKTTAAGISKQGAVVVRDIHLRPPGHEVKRAAEPPRSPARPPLESARETLKRARIAWDAGDVVGALSLARQAVTAGGGAEAHVLVGTLLLKENQRPEARHELDEALRLDPTNRTASKLLELAQERGTP
jgi:serine/threonine protein kinase